MDFIAIEDFRSVAGSRRRAPGGGKSFAGCARAPWRLAQSAPGGSHPARARTEDVAGGHFTRAEAARAAKLVDRTNLKRHQGMRLRADRDGSADAGAHGAGQHVLRNRPSAEASVSVPPGAPRLAARPVPVLLGVEPGDMKTSGGAEALRGCP